MGVNGLWTLVESAGKAVPLEALENKVLAVDVSLWLNQAVKGFRNEAAGGPIPYAHLLGLFHRVCKLLFYRIKPIFVFDGPPPALKRQTLARRRLGKAKAKGKADAARTKIIQNFIRGQIAARKVQTQTQTLNKVLEGGQEQLSLLLNRRAKQQEDKDLFDLPPLPEDSECRFLDSSEDEDGDDVLSFLSIDRSTDIHQVDVEGQAFKSLSTQKQAEVLLELRDRRKQNSWAKLGEMPREAQTFSGFQLERLKRRSALHKKLDEVAAETKEDQLALMDAKLFVGDREGLRREKEKRKKLVLGPGFAYFEKVPTATGEPKASTSKCKEEDEEESELTQEEILKTIDVKNDDVDEDDDEILIVEPSEGLVGCARKGGATIIKVEPRSPMAEVKLSSDESSSSDEFVEVEIDPKASVQKEDDLFADVFDNEKSHVALDEILASRKRKIQDSDKEVDSGSKKAKENKIENITSTMKGQSHLFLKIAARFAEENSPQKKQSQSEKRIPNYAAEGQKAKDGMAEMLEKETSSLVEEMRETVSREKLLRARQEKPVMRAALFGRTDKTGEADRIGIPDKTGEADRTGIPDRTDKRDRTDKPGRSDKPGKTDDSEEKAILNSLDVEVHDKETYENSVIQSTEDDQVVFSASAPGFVKSKRDAEAVEVSHELGEDVLRKFNDDAGGEREEDLLSREELAKIQADIAREHNALVAERGRQDRIAASVSDQMYSECQNLLQLFGLPWIVSPGEAEAECAFLDIIGLSHGTITDDSDVWVFGGQRVYKNFFNQSRHCEHFSAIELARHLGLSREKMIQLAMLTGSDYSDGLDLVGPVTAMEILAEFAKDKDKDILAPLVHFKKWWTDRQKKPPENSVREKLKRLNLPENFPNRVIAKAYLDPLVDNSTEAFSWAVPNLVEISDFAREKFGWTKQKVDDILKPLIKRLDSKIGSSSQARIDDYFSRDRLQLPKTGGLAENSKRVRSAIDKVLGRVDSPEDTKAKSVKTSKQPQDPKAKAIEIYKKSMVKRGKKKKKMQPKRIVLETHNLSESSSD